MSGSSTPSRTITKRRSEMALIDFEPAGSPGQTATRKIAIALGFVLLLALVAKPLWEAREQWHWGQGQDDGAYWVTAKSLADGDGYRVASLPGRPYAVKYPPLYPLFLSIAW